MTCDRPIEILALEASRSGMECRWEMNKEAHLDMLKFGAFGAFLLAF
jgi:hypothetical protein